MPSRALHAHADDNVLTRLAGQFEARIVESTSREIRFFDDTIEVHATYQDGAGTIRIRAYLGTHDLDSVTDWVESQPPSPSGLLQVMEADGDDYEPRLLFERSADISDWHGDTLADEVKRFAHAWIDDTVADVSNLEPATLHDPIARQPSSGWLLFGDAASYPDGEGLAIARAKARVGIHDYLWTAAKQTLLGDLVLLYFVAPTKSVTFVARAACDAFFSRDISVNAETAVASTQRWVYLTEPVEIEPIPFARLQQVSDGHLVLKGRSGKYLRPDVIQSLDVMARRPEDRERVEQIMTVPVGLADLPRDPADIDLDTWKSIAAGALPLESHVSSYIVEPLLRELLRRDDQTFEREHRVGRRSVDYVVTTHGEPTCAIEVKLATVEPPGGVWAASQDYWQLRRYMDDLGAPGILIDAHRVLLVDPGGNAPKADILRTTASRQDFDAIRAHLGG